MGDGWVSPQGAYPSVWDGWMGLAIAYVQRKEAGSILIFEFWHWYFGILNFENHCEYWL